MKFSIILLAFTAAAFSSCTTAYKTGQTPDDVYYSPVRPQDEYVRVEKQDPRYYRGSHDYYEDRFLRMRLMDRYRWSALDDYYFNNTYAYNAYGNYYSWNNPWNSYYAWNSYYNPYYGGLPYYGGMPYYGGVINIKNPVRYTPPSRAVAFNPNSYNNNNSNRPATGARTYSNGYNNSNQGYNNSNRNTNNNSLGESVRKMFSNSNSNNNNTYNSNNNSTPTRSYTPPANTNTSTQSSDGGGGGGGVTRPPR